MTCSCWLEAVHNRVQGYPSHDKQTANSGISSAAWEVANLGLVRPPLVYLASLISGALIHRGLPLLFLPRALAEPPGVPLVAMAIALFSHLVAKFRAAGFPVPARKPTP